MSRSMSNADNFWLCMDDPTNLMVITAFMEFETPVDLKRLRATIETRLSSFPRFRKRVVRPASGIGVPVWEDDPHYDIRSHISRVALPTPGGKTELQEMVSDLMTTPLDPNKPLWQVHLIENYGNGCVILFRIHHCIADGIALVQVLLAAADTEPDAPWPEDLPEPQKRTSAFDVNWPLIGLVKRVQNATETGRKLGLRLVEEVGKSFLQWNHFLEWGRKGSEVTTEVGKVLSELMLMPSDPATAFKGGLGVRKCAAWTDPIPLETIKRVGHAIHGATINDVLISSVSGAMRRYLETRNYPVNKLDLRVLVPVNIRKPGTETELGNKFSLVFLPLPVYIEDPVLRLQEVKRRMDRLKTSPDAVVIFTLLSVVGVLPPYLAKTVLPFFSNKASAVLTNVPGPRQPLYFAGEKIHNMMFWVPRAGNIGLGISILSYDGKVTVGLAADEGLMPDAEVLLEGFESEFSHLLDLVDSGKIEHEPLVLHDRYQETRCKGLTKNGQQCRRRAAPGSQYCSLHGGNEPWEAVILEEHGEVERKKETYPEASETQPMQCQAVTQSGRQCKRQAIPGSRYCRTHQPQVKEEDIHELASILKELSGR